MAQKTGPAGFPVLSRKAGKGALSPVSPEPTTGSRGRLRVMEALPALGVLLAAVLGRLCSLHEAEITRNCCEGIFEIDLG